MNSNKTVGVYSDEEFDNQGLSGAIKSKNGRRSFFIPLIGSILAAFGLWLFVIWGNNTCTGIPILLVGNEQLMSNNYTVSSIEPATVDLVFRGKDDVIKRITADPSLVTASVYVFGSNEEDGETIDGVFDSEDQIAEGEYTVELKISTPEGVTCSTKSVKITVSKASSKEFSTNDAGVAPNGPVRLNMSNYSFANGISLDSQTVVEKSVTVIGDQKRVESIDYISLNVDWLKDLTGDATVYVTPVACDRYGDVIDSEFLRFEPSSLEVNVKVNKYKTLSLVTKKEAGDTANYTLSTASVVVIGPVLEIDRLPDTIEISVLKQNLAQKNYLLNASDLGRNIKFLTNDGEESTFTVIVEKQKNVLVTDVEISAEDIIVLPPSEDLYELAEEKVIVRVEYLPLSVESSRLTAEDLIVVLDLSKAAVGSGEYDLSVSFKPGGTKAERYISVICEKVSVIVRDAPAESTEG